MSDFIELTQPHPCRAEGHPFHRPAPVAWEAWCPSAPDSEPGVTTWEWVCDDCKTRWGYRDAIPLRVGAPLPGQEDCLWGAVALYADKRVWERLVEPEVESTRDLLAGWSEREWGQYPTYDQVLFAARREQLGSTSWHVDGGKRKVLATAVTRTGIPFFTPVKIVQGEDVYATAFPLDEEGLPTCDIPGCNMEMRYDAELRHSGGVWASLCGEHFLEKAGRLGEGLGQAAVQLEDL